MRRARCARSARRSPRCSTTSPPGWTARRPADSKPTGHPMNEERWLIQVSIFLAAAVIGVPILKRLGLSSVLGYIIAGAAIGPWDLKLAGGVEGDGAVDK